MIMTFHFKSKMTTIYIVKMTSGNSSKTCQ